MNWLHRLEVKFGRYAIRNLPLYIVGLYLIGTILDLISQGRIYYIINLNPYLVLHGQPWRIVSFLLAPPSTNIIFLVFVLLFYYSIGMELTNVWGAFKFNLYVIFGVLATIVGAFLAYAVTKSPYINIDAYYIILSMFLAYATIFPEAQVYLYGILPIKVKWLGMLDVALLAYSFYVGGMGDRIAIITSLLNFILFYFSTRNYHKISPQQIKRRRSYKKQVSQPASASRHRCAICNRTEKDDPTLEFRFCSKCNGDYEYCNEHLFTHTHVK